MFHLVSLFLFSNANAAPDLDKGVTVHLERTVDASAAESWSMLGENFVDIGSWASGLDSRPLQISEVPDGIAAHPAAPVPGRMVSVDGQDDQIQVLVDFAPEARVFTFQAGNPPKVIAYATNTHTIVDEGNGRSRIVIDVVLVPKGVAKLLKGKIEKKYTAYLEAYLDEAEAGLTGGAVDGAS